MEDAVYVCCWKRSKGGFVLWVKSRPKVRGEGSNYEEAEERLIEAIHAAGGAMVAVLEFDRPLPKAALQAKYGNPELYMIGGDDRFQTDAPKSMAFETAEERNERFKWNDAFYESPVCRKCAYSKGPRSEKPLFLTHVPRRYDGASGGVGHEAGHLIEILSQEFLDLLTSEERQSLQLRPVTGEGRDRFFELVGPAGPPFVGAADLNPVGWRCGICGIRRVGSQTKDFTILRFVAQADLPSPLPGIFTVGGANEVNLAATATRWRQLVGRKGTRGFVSLMLGVVPDRELVREAEPPPAKDSFGSNP